MAFRLFDCRSHALLIAGLCLVLAGCGKPEEITRYTIPKPKPFGAAQTAVESRLLGAIIPKGEKTWFFKMMGPVKAVAEQIEPFLKFLKSVHFEKDQPAWTLPEGWREQAGQGMRFATLKIGSESPPLELTVIQLPSNPAQLEEELLANVNRWRGQVQLAPITRDDLAAETTSVPLDGVTATIVSITGRAAPGGGMGAAPFAGAGRLAPVTSSANDAPELVYDTPQGWTTVQRGSMSKATFDVADGKQKVEITVTPLAAAAGETLPNVNRWRAQVKLPDVDAKALAKDMKTIPVGGRRGDYVELVGKGKTDQPETILGVIVKDKEQSWFIKLRGDADLAAREKTRFEEFVASLRFGKSQ